MKLTYSMLILSAFLVANQLFADIREVIIENPLRGEPNAEFVLTEDDVLECLNKLTEKEAWESGFLWFKKAHLVFECKIRSHQDYSNVVGKAHVAGDNFHAAFSTDQILIKLTVPYKGEGRDYSMEAGSLILYAFDRIMDPGKQIGLELPYFNDPALNSASGIQAPSKYECSSCGNN